MTQTANWEADFWRIFARTIGRPIESGNHHRSDLPEWDSLRHVELVFELEERFGLQIPPEAVAALFSDTDTVIAYLRTHCASRS